MAGNGGGWRLPITQPHRTVEDAGPMVFVGGAGDFGSGGSIVHPGDFDAQVQGAMANVAADLGRRGCSLADVVRLKAFYKSDGSRDEWALLAALRRAFDADLAPAITTHPVPQQAFDGQEIQIQAMATKGWRDGPNVRSVEAPVPDHVAALFDRPRYTRGLRAGELDFRDWLASTQDPAKKKNIREHRRRTGRIQYGEKDGKKKIIWGPYKLKVRQDILKRLLKAQTEVQKNGPDPNMELIQKQELHNIRRLWVHEEGDWEDTLPSIYNEIIGGSLNWVTDDASGLGGEEKKLISDVCNKHELNPILLMELFDVEQAHQGMAKRRGIYDKIGLVLNKDWRTREEALAELENAEQESEVEAALG